MCPTQAHGFFQAATIQKTVNQAGSKTISTANSVNYTQFADRTDNLLTERSAPGFKTILMAGPEMPARLTSKPSRESGTDLLASERADNLSSSTGIHEVEAQFHQFPDHFRLYILCLDGMRAKFPSYWVVAP